MSTDLIPSEASPYRKYFETPRVLIWRSLTLGFPLLGVVLLSITLGFNNSAAAKELPQNISNCNVDNDVLYLYSSSFLTRSINIFDGIWLGFSCLAVVYQAIIFLISLIKCDNVNFARLLTADIAISTMFMWVFVDGAAGAFLMGFLWSAYRSGMDLADNMASTAVAISTLQYIAFGCFIVCMSFYYNVVINGTTYCARNACCKKSKDENEVLKSMSKDSTF